MFNRLVPRHVTGVNSLVLSNFEPKQHLPNLYHPLSTGSPHQNSPSLLTSSTHNFSHLEVSPKHSNPRSQYGSCFSTRHYQNMAIPQHQRRSREKPHPQHLKPTPETKPQPASHPSSSSMSKPCRLQAR